MYILSISHVTEPFPSQCVSCAGLGSVEFSEFTPSGDYLGHPFHCQSSITYQVHVKHLRVHVHVHVHICTISSILPIAMYMYSAVAIEEVFCTPSLLCLYNQYVHFICVSFVTPPHAQVATTPADANEFLTCEDRGFVRLYDLRVKSSCHCDGCQKVSVQSTCTCTYIYMIP